jgi:predicted Fe-Mo cluster-binding NifX family protein
MEALMTIAIPNRGGWVSPLFDTAARLLLVHQGQGRAIDRRDIQLDLLPAARLARSLTDWHIDVLLCAAISEPMLRLLQRVGIRVVRHLCGEVDAVVQAFWEGNLSRPEFRMPGCVGGHSYRGGRRLRRGHPSDLRASRRKKWLASPPIA